jgi:hypothetical protein
MLYTFRAPQALSMKLLGVYAVKKKIFADMNPFIACRKYHLLIAGVLALSYRPFINYYIMPTFVREIDPYLGYVLITLFFISNMVVAQP